MRFMPARIGRNRLVGFRRVGEGRIPSIIRMALRDPATSRDASACRNRMKPLPTDHAPAGDIPIAFRFSVCPGKGGVDFRSPTPQSPPVWRGRSIGCPMTYSPPDGSVWRRGERSNSDPSLCSSTDIGISSVSPALVRTIDGSIGLGLCACLASGNGMQTCPRHAGMDCRHPEHRDVTPPSPSLALDANPRSATRPTITESAVGSLGGVRAGEARALRARDGRPADPPGA